MTSVSIADALLVLLTHVASKNTTTTVAEVFNSLSVTAADLHRPPSNDVPLRESDTTSTVADRTAAADDDDPPGVPARTDEEGVSVVGATHSLCTAIIARDIDTVTMYLEAAPYLATMIHDEGWYPLHAAVLSNDIEMVELILSQPGINVDVLDTSVYRPEALSLRRDALGTTTTTKTTGSTPLHYACMIGSIEIIEALFKAGASPGDQDYDGRVPADYFSPRSHLEAMKRFTELCREKRKRDNFYGDQSYRLSEAAEAIRDKDFDLFKAILQQDPDVTKKTIPDGRTLLQLASKHELSHFVDAILSTNSTISMVDRLGGNNDVDDSDDDDDSVLGDWTHVPFQAPAPQDSPPVPAKKATALHHACAARNIAIVKSLLDVGASWSIEDWQGRTPEQNIFDDGSDEARMFKEDYIRLRDEEDQKRKEMHRKKEEEGGSETAETPKTSPESRPIEVVIGEKIIGQRGPIRSVANAVRLRNHDWVDPDRPLVMLFLGSSGVGKTEVAKQLALHMHGKDGLATDKGQSVRDIEKAYGFIRVDMSEYQERHTVSNLYGSPKSYVGYGEGGYLTTRLHTNPKAIVLLDEIEKAHPDVLTLFLQVFDDGRLTDTKLGVVDCKDAIFIMTSNVGSDIIKDNSAFLHESVDEAEKQGRPEEYLRIVRDFNQCLYPVLKTYFKRDEFLGRINQIIVFLPLTPEEITLVVEGELNMWRKRADEKHSIPLTWGKDVVDKLALAYDKNYGVRSVINQVQHIAVQLLAESHIRGALDKNVRAHLTLNHVGDIVLEPMDGHLGRRLPYMGCVYPVI